MPDIAIKELSPEEIPAALDLVQRVFMEYEAPDYSDEGIHEFFGSLCDENYLSKLKMYGAFSEGELLGVIATRSLGMHIALFFVDGKYHRRGIGRALFETVLKACPAEIMTVNSSPYAVPIYRRLGFRETDTEQTVNGLRFIPMTFSGLVNSEE